LAPPRAVQEVEGDAVFAFGLDGAIVPATALLDVVDDAFVAFKARRRVLAADESCSCRACRSVGSLDLKIIAHHGAFLRQTVAGRANSRFLALTCARYRPTSWSPHRCPAVSRNPRRA